MAKLAGPAKPEHQRVGKSAEKALEATSAEAVTATSPDGINKKKAKKKKKAAAASQDAEQADQPAQEDVADAHTEEATTLPAPAAPADTKAKKKKKNKKAKNATPADAAAAHTNEPEPAGKGDEIDDIFTNGLEQVAKQLREAKAKLALEQGGNKRAALPMAEDDTFFDSRGLHNKKRQKVDGVFVYNLDELGVGKGGDTEECPFDCKCCY